MKILDKTPYRTESGEIDIFGRVQGTFAHGSSWYARVQAQDAAIAIMEKVLGEKYVLVRNVILPDTEIELPLVLVGPPGVFLIYVTHERGVYRAKDDEWGTVRGEKFVPAATNQVKRTLKLGQVLQVYLDRAGFKDSLVVEPILMSANPGTHIESTRPAVRIIMSDALERFAISINQGRAILGADAVYKIVKTIMTGSETKAQPASSAESTSATPANGGRDTADALFAGAHQDSDQNTGYQDTGFQGLETGEAAFRDVDAPVFDSSQAEGQAFEVSQPNAQPKSGGRPQTPASKKKGLFGMTTRQLVILGVIMLCWLCATAGFAAFVYFNLNG